MKLSIHRFKYKNTIGLRAISINGAPWFHAKDICNALEYTEWHDMILRYVDPKDTLRQGDITRGENGEMIYINETGLEALFLRAKPTSRKFKKWILEEIIPQLRNLPSVNQVLIKRLPKLSSLNKGLKKMMETT